MPPVRKTVKKLLVMIYLVFVSNFAIGQLDPSLRFSPAFFWEQSSPFAFKRSKDYNAKYNIGLGADLSLGLNKYNVGKRRGFTFGPSVGQYYFWNNSVKTQEHNFEYRENNLISPFMMNLNFGNDPRQIFRRMKRIAYSLDVAAGVAYVQNTIIPVQSASILTSKKWAEIFKVRLHVFYSPANRRFPIIGFGIQYVHLDGRSFRSAFY